VQNPARQRLILLLSLREIVHQPRSGPQSVDRATATPARPGAWS